MNPLKQRIREASARIEREYPGSEQFWTDLRDDMEGVPDGKRRHPTTAALRKALKSGRPVPEWAADYICDRIDGTVRLPRGVPDWSIVGLTLGEALTFCPRRLAAHTSWIEREFHKRKVRQWERILKHPRYVREYKRRHGRLPPKGNVYRQALENWSAKTKIPSDTLDQYVYPRRRK